jgi:hypothetical protein
MKCLLCYCEGVISPECRVCKGTGKDYRKWYLLVGWSQNCKTGYYKTTFNWDEVMQHISEGMEVYGYADSLQGINKLTKEFYAKGGWFYR